MLIRVTFKKIKHEGDFWCPNCSPQSSSSFFPRDNHYPEVGMKSLSQLFLYFYTHSHKQHTILFCFKTIHKRLHITYLSTSCFSHSTVYFHPAALFRVFFFFFFFWLHSNICAGEKPESQWYPASSPGEARVPSRFSASREQWWCHLFFLQSPHHLAQCTTPHQALLNNA